MNTIKTGLVSFGLSGQIFHAPFISSDSHFELTAICERTKNLSREKYPKTRIVRSFDELLAMDELELIVVNSPDTTHYDFVRRALEAGKNVVVEKPITRTAMQAAELATFARKQGLMLSVFQNRRWDGDFLTVQSLLQARTLGRLVEFESNFPLYKPQVNLNEWRETGVDGAGVTYDLGAHLVDQAVQLFGLPEAVYADVAQLREGTRVDDYCLIRLLRPSKAPEVKITLKAGYLMCAREPRFVLHGTKGSYVKYGLDQQEACLRRGLLPGHPQWGEEDEALWGELHTEADGKEFRTKLPTLHGNYSAYYDNIYRHLRHGETLLTDAATVANVIRILEVACLSSEVEKIIEPGYL